MSSSPRVILVYIRNPYKSNVREERIQITPRNIHRNMFAGKFKFRRAGRKWKVFKTKIEHADNDLSDLKSMKYYCKGRGCRHQGPPEFKPTALCFYIRGSGCSHVDVKHRIEDLLGVCPGAKIESIQFVPLSVHLDTVDSDQRWTVIMNSVEARNRLAGTMCHIKGQRVVLRRHDDIIQLEYRKCSHAPHIRQMVSKIQSLDNELDDISNI